MMKRINNSGEQGKWIKSVIPNEDYICLLCDGKAEIYPDYLCFYMVQYNMCGIRTERKREESEVINDWNRRTNDEQT